MIRNPFRNLDQKKLSRSSDVLKTQNDYYKIVNRRIFIFAIIIVAIFVVIAIKLMFLQVRDQEEYIAKLENYSSKTQVDAPPRGEMFDRNGNALVKSVASHNIIYFPPKDVKSADQWELAGKISKQFNVKNDTMTTSDYQDLYMFLHKNAEGKKDNGENLLTEKEKNDTLLAMADKEKLIRSRITKEMVDELADDETKSAFVVYLAMRKLPTESTKVVLEDVSNEDVAYLMEHKSEYPGFDVDFASWKRDYPYDKMLKDVLGNVTTSKQGVPSESRNYYEANGYALTSRVGSSGLEQQYESLLAGTPKKSDISYDEDKIAVLNEASSGKKGYDLHLTIDVDIQKKADETLEKVLKKYKNTTTRDDLKQLFVVMMNPNTGEIYAMSGMDSTEKGEIYPFASGNYLSSFMPGSIVKGATVYMGLSQDVVTKDTTILDVPIRIKDTPEKSSFNKTGNGNVNAIKALQVSSNVYMFHLAIMTAGGTYVPNQPLIIPDVRNSFNVMRSYYSMFGLGTKTGLDVPNEVNGGLSYSDNAGTLLDYAIGQFETYSPIQLAQYVSTIANGGKKVEPKLVNTATEVNSDYVVFDNKTKVLSTLPGRENDLKTVQEGFRACVTSNNCGLPISNIKEGVAAKTGTAEVKVDGKDRTNAALIGYAPYNDPDVAFACLAPTSSSNNAVDVGSNLCSTEIMGPILEEFFKKY